MIHNKTVKQLYERTKGYCECGCGRHFIFGEAFIEGFGPEVHHIYRKSQYKKNDRDDIRNLSLLYSECHKKIHNGQNRELDKRLKQEADKRKPVEERSTKKVTRKKAVYGGNFRKYDKKVAQEIRNAGIDYFKETHDGLTPSRYAYRQQKLYLQNIKNAKRKK